MACFQLQRGKILGSREFFSFCQTIVEIFRGLKTKEHNNNVNCDITSYGNCQWGGKKSSGRKEPFVMKTQIFVKSIFLMY